MALIVEKFKSYVKVDRSANLSKNGKNEIGNRKGKTSLKKAEES